MATEIRMPRLGHSMTEGTVVAWLAKQGETVRAGQIILTIETDKAEYEVEAPADGLLSEPLVVEAATAPVEAVLGWVLEPGEARPSAPAESGDQGTARPAPAPSAAPARGRVRASPKARRLAEERGVELSTVAGSGPEGLVTEADVERAASSAKPSGAADSSEWSGRRVRERRRLSPIRRTTARRMAEGWA